MVLLIFFLFTFLFSFFSSFQVQLGPERDRERERTSAEMTTGTRPESGRATTTRNDVAIETRAHRRPLADGHRQTPLRDLDRYPPPNARTPGAGGTGDPRPRPKTTQLAILQLVLPSLPRTPHSEAKPSPAHPRRGLPYRATPISTRPHTGVQAHGGPHVSDGQVNISSLSFFN